MHSYRMSGVVSFLIAIPMIVIACSQATAPPDPSFGRGNGNGGGPPAGGGGGGGGSSNEDALIVAFDDTRGGVMSDGRDADLDGAVDPYVDGTDQVHAVITDVGQFQMRVNDEGGTPIRFVAVRVEDARSGAEGTVLVEGLAEARLQSKRASDPGGLDLRGMAIGESAPTPIRILWDDGDLSWRLRFGRVCNEPDAGNTPVPGQMMQVTRTAQDSWVLTTSVAGVERTGRLCLLDRSVKRKDQMVVTVSDEVLSPFTITIRLG